jgi:hypothetical protein
MRKRLFLAAFEQRRHYNIRYSERHGRVIDLPVLDFIQQKLLYPLQQQMAVPHLFLTTRRKIRIVIKVTIPSIVQLGVVEKKDSEEKFLITNYRAA